MEVKALQQMLAQFRQVQETLEKRIGEISVEASAGGGMVSVKMNGQKQLTGVHIEPEVFKSKDQEMLQELVLAAVNEANRRVDEELSRQMKDLTGSVPGIMGLKIPGLF
ncbi:MAG: YbaB/EbfC family nucleoid-associated protein [Acidobacteriia bacterium]|nr:YbaB/EbfC family nucleoid-associated protein [Terriglobia bacterium]